MTIKQGKDIDNDVFWGKVSHLMGGRRGRQQCRIKWSAWVTPLVEYTTHGGYRTDALSKTVKNEGLKPRWNQQDAFILVHKLVTYPTFAIKLPMSSLTELTPWASEMIPK